MDVRRCMIVTSANQAFAQALCVGLSPATGANMFIAGLSATGTAPATHYITEGPIKDTFAALLADANALYAACQAHIPQVNATLAQCQNLLAQSDVSMDMPFDAMNRLGLKIISLPL